MSRQNFCQTVRINYEECVPVEICKNCEGWKECEYKEDHNAVNFFYDTVNCYVVLDNNKEFSIVFEVEPDLCECEL